MPALYKPLAVLILLTGLVASGAIAATRYVAKPKQPGLYTLAELPRVIPFPLWLPHYVPPGLHQLSGYYVLPRVPQVDVEYDGPRSELHPLTRGLSVSIAPVGKMVAEFRGIGQDARDEDVHGVQARLDSWRSSDRHGRDPGHQYRMLRWSEQGLEFFVFAKDVNDPELGKVARSLAPVSQ